MSSSYKDEPYSPASGSSTEHVEMEERRDHFVGQQEEDGKQEQEQRLLPGDDDLESAVNVIYKVEWHLRTGWAVAASFLVAALVFVALVVFTKSFIAKPHVEQEPHELSSAETFRTSPGSYILDPSWNHNTPPRIREYSWTIVDIVGNPDGVFRPMIAINGQFPGPMIECNEGDTLVIEVDNQSVNATSIHFHGIFQNGTNWMDGTTGVTQCPIAPRKRFRYEFTVTGQSGTYFYHGHQAVQASDGLYGPVVIHSRDEKKLEQIPYASDRVVMLQDHYHDLSSGLLRTFLSPGNEASPIPDGALINGLNKRDCSQLGGRLCDNSTASMSAFHLDANANHRLRFINVAAFAWFQVGIDEHEMAIVEADGTDILPVSTTRLMISPAQRYSVVISTNQTTGDSFWLRARMVTHCFKEPELPVPGADEVRAIVQYTASSRSRSKGQAAISQPTSSNWPQGIEVTCKDMNTTSFVPAVYQPPPPTADYSYFLRSNLEIGDWRLERGFFNTSTFRPNLQQPTLHRSVEGHRSQNATFISTANSDGVNSVCYDLTNDFVIQHSGIKTVDLIVQNFDEGNHPMHLHGHKFWVLGQGHGPFPGYETLGLKPEGRGILDGQEGGLDNLIRRDVATAEGFGWLALRFVADNPGVWAFHCHMAWHSEAGLVMQFLSRVDEVSTWEVPEANRRLCEADVQELERGAAPKDSIWFGFGVGG